MTAPPVIDFHVHMLDELKGTEHPIAAVAERTARRWRLVCFEFDALCGGPRSYADYVDLAKRFHTVILSNEPRLSVKASDAARRSLRAP